uniref:Membrane-associated phosphatidylinositol transfer protein 2 n=1 Tax=Cacopsylla melanoneura TaxID=428564 RepID=A0A8D8WT65_9HEMI
MMLYQRVVLRSRRWHKSNQLLTLISPSPSGVGKSQREVVHIDIGNDPVSPGDYKETEDPAKFNSEKTGRGPLEGNWIEKARSAPFPLPPCSPPPPLSYNTIWPITIENDTTVVEITCNSSNNIITSNSSMTQSKKIKMTKKKKMTTTLPPFLPPPR